MFLSEEHEDLFASPGNLAEGFGIETMLNGSTSHGSLILGLHSACRFLIEPSRWLVSGVLLGSFYFVVNHNNVINFMYLT